MRLVVTQVDWFTVHGSRLVTWLAEKPDEFCIRFSCQLPDLNIVLARAGFNLHHSPTVNREPLNHEPV